ncbi:hypothetical protein Ciccas_012676 [Cichlidogyrus casuarinus]|uniref:Transposase n=1 Tax=Cichlidogyrus casuarinus TaxID=1844966 RepID=A0ABD2PQ21_9PLAT
MKVHVDETNFNMFTLRKFGRAVKGLAPLVPRRASKGVNLNVVLAINDLGQVLLMRTYVGTIVPYFQEFMRTLSGMLEIHMGCSLAAYFSFFPSLSLRISSVKKLIKDNSAELRLWILGIYEQLFRIGTSRQFGIGLSMAETVYARKVNANILKRLALRLIYGH